MDKLTLTQRSKLMSRVRSIDTKPELTVRSIAHRMGYRFRLLGQGEEHVVSSLLGSLPQCTCRA